MLRTGYVAKRVFFAAVTIFVSITLNFFLFRVMSGDAVSNMARVPHAGPELRHALTVEFGLDKSKFEQYLLYLRNLAEGNMGISFTYRRPVSELLMVDLRNTVLLVAVGTLASILIGTAAGVLSARKRDTPTDHINSGMAILAYGLPAQWLGLVVLIMFSGVLPSAGMSESFALGPQPLWAQISDVGRHMILPTLTLVLVGYGGYMLVVRSAMLETMGEDYILTARAKGLSPRRIVVRHAARNAMLPVVTQAALDFGYVVGGAVLVEIIFSWPGIGEALYAAISQRDYPMLQGGFLILTVSVVVMNLLADLLYYKLDPRVTE